MTILPTVGTATAGTSSVRLSLSGQFNGLPTAAIRDDTITNSGSPLKLEEVPLTTGWNELTIPTGATSVRIVPPGDNALALVLKGADADTGIKMQPTVGGWMSLADDATVGVDAAGEVTVQVIWM